VSEGGRWIRRVGAGGTADEIAAELERRLAAVRASAQVLWGADADRAMHVAAIEHLAEYAAMLRALVERPAAAAEASEPTLARYLLKLELADGRWDLVERNLPERPRPGTLLDLCSCGAWQVRDSAFVFAATPRKPPYEYFVCQPAA
jgi:hypothetical protein